MYEWPDLPDGYYSFWGTEPQRPDRILKDLEQSIIPNYILSKALDKIQNEQIA